MGAVIGIIILGSVLGWGVSKGLDKVTAPQPPAASASLAQTSVADKR